MDIQTKDFEQEIRQNKLEYIELLEKSLDNELNIAKKAIAKIKEISEENEQLKKLLGSSIDDVTNNKLSEALIRVGCLEGVVSEHREDEISICAGHVNDYLLATYLGQLLERGELKIEIAPERMEYLERLLKEGIDPHDKIKNEIANIMHNEFVKD